MRAALGPLPLKSRKHLAGDRTTIISYKNQTFAESKRKSFNMTINNHFYSSMLRSGEQMMSPNVERAKLSP